MLFYNYSGEDEKIIKPIKVILAEDHPVTAKLISNSIENAGNFRIVGIANNGRDLINMALNRDFDIGIFDINMPFIDGMSALQRIINNKIGSKIIIYSGHIESWIIRKCLFEGASAYVSKFSDYSELIRALIAVANGETFLDKEAKSAIDMNDEVHEHQDSKYLSFA